MKLHEIRLSLLAMIMLSAVQLYSKSQDYDFYLKVGSGLSFSQLGDVVAPYPPWDPAFQGYNATFGRCPIASFTVGYELFHILDLEVTISNRSIFEYRKFQTSTISAESYTREFDLNVTPIIFSANFLGRGVSHLHYDVGSSGIFYPMLGAGIGVSNLLVTNFRTIGLPATGGSSPFDSFSAGNQYSLSQNFTYTLLAGIEYSHGDRWAIGTGYRWLNAGNFQGPQYLRDQTGAAVDVSGSQWQMNFRANEWFIEFKIFI